MGSETKKRTPINYKNPSVYILLRQRDLLCEWGKILYFNYV